MKASEIKSGETYVSEHKSGYCVFRRVLEILPTLDGKRMYVRAINLASKRIDEILLESFARWADKHVPMGLRNRPDMAPGALISELIGNRNP